MGGGGLPPRIERGGRQMGTSRISLGEKNRSGRGKGTPMGKGRKSSKQTLKKPHFIVHTLERKSGLKTGPITGIQQRK